MPHNLAYIRTWTDKQDNDNQKLEIYKYARNRNLKIEEVIAIQISSRRCSIQRRIDEVMDTLKGNDTLTVTEMSRLGRSTSEIIHMINTMIKKNIRIIAIKQGIDINSYSMSSKIVVTIFSLLAEL